MLFAKFFNICLGIILVLCCDLLFGKHITPHAPDSNIVRKQVHKKDGECYVLEPVIYVCPILK